MTESARELAGALSVELNEPFNVAQQKRAERIIAALSAAGFDILKRTKKVERDWPDDAAHENGNYQCTCVVCERGFAGHKRRVVCRSCTDEASAEANRPALLMSAIVKAKTSLDPIDIDDKTWMYSERKGLCVVLQADKMFYIPWSAVKTAIKVAPEKTRRALSAAIRSAKGE